VHVGSQREAALRYIRAARSRLLFPSIGPDEELKDPDPNPRAAALNEGDQDDCNAFSTAFNALRSTPLPEDPFKREDNPFAFPAIAYLTINNQLEA
jgi:hypothetical protein